MYSMCSAQAGPHCLHRCLRMRNWPSLQKRWAVQAGVPPSTVYNALNQSALLTADELATFQLDVAQLHWKLLCAGQWLDPR